MSSARTDYEITGEGLTSERVLEQNPVCRKLHAEAAATARQQILELYERADLDDPLQAAFVGFCMAHAAVAMSQWQQDLFALWALGGKRGGFFVEFGGADGLLHSNSFLLETGYGWDGVLIEPLQRFFLISQYVRNNTYRYCGAIDPGYPERVSRLCLLDSRQGSVLEDYDPFLMGDPGSGTPLRRLGRVTVPGFNLNRILRLAPGQRVDLMTVDTEGAERPILEGLDFSVADIAVLCVEVNGRKGDIEAIAALMRARGFLQVFGSGITREDLWFLNRATADALAARLGMAAGSLGF